MEGELEQVSIQGVKGTRTRIISLLIKNKKSKKSKRRGGEGSGEWRVGDG